MHDPQVKGAGGRRNLQGLPVVILRGLYVGRGGALDQRDGQLIVHLDGTGWDGIPARVAAVDVGMVRPMNLWERIARRVLA